jgi:hypothetical protein
MDNEPAIHLVDNTAPLLTVTNEARTSSLSGPASIVKLLTRGSVRSEIAKRKYAKWQPDRLGVGDTVKKTISQASIASTDVDRNAPESSSGESLNRQRIISESAVAPSLIQNGDQAEGAPEDTNGSTKSAKEMDVLYENQRGLFLFGIPFYSDQSLLQWDDPPWVNREFKDSPVDVRNAQVPDPSWVWAWRTWYVDMSGDVDEEGWQYSFSFHTKFDWHGIHPSFHSFVRRRRWIRLRVKVCRAKRPDLENAHALNEDYFTIHSKPLGSRISSVYAENAPKLVSIHRVSTAWLTGAPVEEIKDIPTLMQALKESIVDRERILSLKKFVAQGGEELRYLEEQVRSAYLPTRSHLLVPPFLAPCLTDYWQRYRK